ncbi:MAG TPA: MFS transporter [Candidatus Dormibacteraeota bacterium]|nr:MFS transporter [Candidatus Dormibacteraeota bacterium]
MSLPGHPGLRRRPARGAGTAPARTRPSTARVLAVTLLLQFCFGLVYVWGVLAPAVRREGWPPLLLGSVWSAAPAGWILGIIVSGRMADRLPPRRLCWASLGIAGVGFAVAMALPNGITLPLFYTGLGLGLGGSFAMAGSLAAGASVLPARVGTVGGALTGAYALAALVQIPAASLLLPRLGWEGTLRTLVGALWLLAAAGLVLLPGLPRPAPRTEGPTVPFRRLVRRPLVVTSLLFQLATAPLGAYGFVFLPTYAHARGGPAWLAPAALAAVAAGNAAGRLGAGAISDHLGLGRLLAGIVACDVAAACLLLLGPAPAALIPSSLVAGLGFGGPAGAISRLGTQAAPDAPSSAIGLTFAGYSSGSALGPLVGAALGPPLSWAVLGACSLAGLALLAVRSRATGGASEGSDESSAA